MANMTPKPSKYPFSGHSYAMRATWQPRLNCKVTISFIFLSFQESEELRCRYRDQPEHQMRHHLGCPAHPHEPSTIIVLQIRVDPLGCAAIPETHRLRRIHLFLLSPPDFRRPTGMARSDSGADISTSGSVSAAPDSPFLHLTMKDAGGLHPISCV